MRPWQAFLLVALALAPQASADTDWAQTDKLTPADGYVTQHHFGRSSAIGSGRLVVGAPGIAEGMGAAFLFENVDGVWSETAELYASDERSFDDFGRAVAISGELIVVGAPGRDSSSGGVYVFERNAAGWTEAAILTRGCHRSGAQFGRSVALAGTTLLVGAPGESVVHVFRRVLGSWTRTGTISSPRGPSDFGFSVVMDGTGMAIVGAPGDKLAFVYQDVGGAFCFLQELSHTSSGQNFGYSLSMHQGTLAVGSPDLDQDGRVDMFDRVGSQWAHVATIQREGLRDDNRFGTAVHVHGDLLVVGAPASETMNGVAALLRRSGSSWSEEAILHPDVEEPGPGTFGLTVSANDTHVFVNVGLDDAPVFGQYAGALNVFARVPIDEPPSPAPGNGSAGASPLIITK